MSYKLFIDDQRTPKMVYYDNMWDEFKNDSDWVIIKTGEQAIDYIKEHGCPEFISFDHDLGWGITGYDVAKWFIENLYNKILVTPENFQYYVHSYNIVGKSNIYQLLDAWFKKGEFSAKF